MSWTFLNLAAVVLVGSSAWGVDPPEPAEVSQEAYETYREIQNDWDKVFNAHQRLMIEAKTDAELRAAYDNPPDPQPFVERCLKLYEQYPTIYPGPHALYWVVQNGKKEQALAAAERFNTEQVATQDLGRLSGVLSFSDLPTLPARLLAPKVYDRVKREPEHARAADLLIWICRASVDDTNPDMVKLCRAAGDQLVERHLDTKYMWYFCGRVLDEFSDPVWVESKSRSILAGQDEAAQIIAAVVLAKTLQNKDAESQAEAEQLYQRVIDDSEKITREWNKKLLRGSEGGLLMSTGKDIWRPRARAALEEMRARGLGKPAPALVGVDLDGQPLSLAEHQGQVVMVSFWATWCGPCMRLVPHERELVQNFAGRPFVLLGVNGDESVEVAKRGVTKSKITWRSFQDERESEEALSKSWGVTGWPTIYLIDHKGIIRKRWVGAPSSTILDQEIEKLVAEAGKGQK